MALWLPQSIPGVFLCEPFRHFDDRGEFVKTFHAPQAEAEGLRFTIREEFFSISQQNVLRGMHLQRKPHGHTKIVYCTSGSIIDVLVDLREDQPSFRTTLSFALNEKNRNVLWIPEGVGHGFLSLENHTCVIYKTDYEHVPESDTGVHWNSIGFDWPVTNPIVSDRDNNLPAIHEYRSGNQVSRLP